MKLANQIRHIFGFEQQKGQIFGAGFRKLKRCALKQSSHTHRAADRCISRVASFMSLLKESDGVCSEHGKGIS